MHVCLFVFNTFRLVYNIIKLEDFIRISTLSYSLVGGYLICFQVFANILLDHAFTEGPMSVPGLDTRM